MNVKIFTHSVVKEFGTSDAFELADKVGVKIVCESWYPVTIGEFERKTKTIRVNERAFENNNASQNLKQTIIAHELGHFFAVDLRLSKSEEEKFAHEFAKNLLGYKS